MTHIKLHHIALDRQKLQNIPPDKRAMLVYAGHISNELNWFNKMMLTLQITGSEIVGCSTELSPVQQAQSAGNAMQVFLITRLYAGKLLEARKFVRKWLFGQAWFDAFKLELPEEAKEAYLQLKEYLIRMKANPEKDLIRTTRDKSAFHYDDEMVGESGDWVESKVELDSYLARDVGNTIYIGSERVILEGLASNAGYDDVGQFFSDFFDECHQVGRWIKDLLGHTVAAIYLKHCGATLDSIGLKAEFEMEAPHIRQFRLPYFFSGS
jgi:hypothetical protein